MNGPHTRLRLFVALCFLASNGLWAQQPDDIIGTWFNAEKNAKIEIFRSEMKYFGKIVWLKDPHVNGKPRTDENNPESELRSRPLMGLSILQNVEFDDDEWDDGTIYDPENGETYECVITKNGNTLHVRGYIGFSFIGRTTEWTRAN